MKDTATSPLRPRPPPLALEGVNATDPALWGISIQPGQNAFAQAARNDEDSGREITPTPNAFAAAARRKVEAAERQRYETNAFYQQEKRRDKANRTESSTLSKDKLPLPADPTVNRNSDASTMTKFPAPTKDLLPEPIKRKKAPEPLKLVPDSWKARATNAPHTLPILVPEDTKHAIPTNRAFIEAKNERKIVRMMATRPETPSPLDPVIEDTTFNGHRGEKHILARSHSTNSPKGKRVSPPRNFFGLKASIANLKQSFNLSPSGDTDKVKMPPKAAQVLGPDKTAKKGRHSDGASKIERSGTSTSLPPKIHDGDIFDDTPLPGQMLPPGRTSYGSPSTKGSKDPKTASSSTSSRTGSKIKINSYTQTPEKVLQVPHNTPMRQLDNRPVVVKRSRSLQYLDNDRPPTPVRKDTPPHLKRPVEASETPSRHKKTTSADASESRNFTSERLSVVMSNAYAAKDRVGLVHKMPSIRSVRPAIETAEADVLRDEHKHTENNDESQIKAAANKGERWSDDMVQRKSSFALDHAQLPPTFYTPSLYSVRGFSHNFDTQIYHLPPRGEHAGERDDNLSKASVNSTRSSRNGSLTFFYPGLASDPNTPQASPSHHMVHVPTFPSFAFDTKDMRSGSDEANSHCAAGAEQSQDPNVTPQKRGDVNGASLGLTPMLAQLPPQDSPRRPFVPLHPSAMPSPINGHFPVMPGMMPPMVNGDGSMPTGEHIITHFDILHKHLMHRTDSLTETMHTNNQMMQQAIINNHNDTLNVVNEHLHDVREQLNAVEHNLSRATEEFDGVHKKLEDLVDIVQKQLVDRMEDMIKSNCELTNKVEVLGDSVTGLEKKYSSLNDKFDQSVKQNREALSAARAGYPQLDPNPQWGQHGGYTMRSNEYQQALQMHPADRERYAAQLSQQYASRYGYN